MADKQLTMADLLAKQEYKNLSLTRGQEIEGTVITITQNEVILDLGTKAEGVLPKRDLTPDQVKNLKIGDKVSTFVVQAENESGQVLLGPQKATQDRRDENRGGSSRGGGSFSSSRFKKFEDAMKREEVLKGTGLELNKGGLIVEVNGVRGFLPSSQVSLSQAANLDDLVGKEIEVVVIEVDPNQNRLIFTQKSQVTEETKEKLGKLKVGDKVEGTVASVLPFGIFVTLSQGVEGLVHISEISWEKVEDPNTLYKIGDKIEAKVNSLDHDTGRANLSVKQLSQDPFLEKVKDFNPDDVIKGEITKVNQMGVFVSLDGGVEGLVHSSKMDQDTTYEVGGSMNFLVDSIDAQKRRVNLAPFITSTKDLIYK